MIRRIFLSLLFVLFSFSLAAEEVVLNPDHPQSYEVIKGDTLWDISGKFLKFPWHWPNIWQVNPQIENPHLIYPGDLLSLVYRDGRPVLELTRGNRTYVMSPEVREIMLEKAISTIPLSAIGPFLSKPQVVGAETLDSAPYIVASADERLLSGAGDIVYVRGVEESQGKNYSVFRGGKVYQDPDTEEVLGYEAIYTGDALLRQFGDPATVELTKTNREVRIGDRLLYIEDQSYDLNFIPRSPDQDIDGRIISVFDGVSQIGQYQIVVLNRGARDGLETGHVLSIFQAGNTVRDTVISKKYDEDYFNTKNKDVDRNAMITLPDEYAGVAMIFKIFDKVSYAIVMKATRAIHLDDRVTSAE